VCKSCAVPGLQGDFRPLRSKVFLTHCSPLLPASPSERMVVYIENGSKLHLLKLKQKKAPSISALSIHTSKMSSSAINMKGAAGIAVQVMLFILAP